MTREPDDVERPRRRRRAPETPSVAAASDALLDEIALGPRSTTDAVVTGFPSVDTMLGGGVRRGDLVVLCGEVGAGKSAMALAIALRAAETGAHCAYYTGEMTPARVVERALGVEARVRIDDLRRGTLDAESQTRLLATAERLRGHLPYIAALAAGELEDIDASLDVLGPADFVVVDPLQWLSRGKQPIADELASAVQALKAIARDRQAAMLLTTHLPAMPAERHDRRPQLDDIGVHGIVKQTADVVLGLYRHAMYDRAADVDGATELLVLKNRNGPTGYIDLYYYKEWLRFEDMVEPDR